MYSDPRLISPQCPSLVPVETLHENPWFVVRNRGGYYTTEFRQPSVVILPIVDNSSILMVRVKRPLLSDTPLELPAGSVLDNELPVQGASRELAEEAGIEILDVERFKSMPPIAESPNRSPCLLHVFKIDISTFEYSHRQKHDEEIESVELLNFEQVYTYVAKGNFYVSTPMAVVLRFILSLQSK